MEKRPVLFGDELKPSMTRLQAQEWAKKVMPKALKDASFEVVIEGISHSSPKQKYWAVKYETWF